jgi:hypothetical protein
MEKIQDFQSILGKNDTGNIFICIEKEHRGNQTEGIASCQKCKKAVCYECYMRFYNGKFCDCGCDDFWSYQHKVNKQAQKLPVETKRTYSACKKHPEYEAYWWCSGIKGQECNQIVCCECTSSDHVGHNFKLMTHYIKDNVNSIQGFQKHITATREVVEDYSKTLESDKKIGEDYYDDLIKQVERKKAEVIDLIKQCKADKIKQIESSSLGDLPELKRTCEMKEKEFGKRLGIIREFKDNFVDGKFFINS